jgi:cyanophycinase
MIIPMASSDPENVAENQVEQFKKFQPHSVDYVLFSSQEADSDSILSLFDQISGIFFSGGDQRRLTELLLGTRLLERIRDIYNNGGVISGTSAGAAVMSNIMITGDEILHSDSKNAFGYIQRKNIENSAGFGFIERAIIDQHFIYRKRHNRLISLVLENPDLLGIGIDESTAIKVNPDRTFEVIGDYQVIVYDASASRLQKDFNEGFMSAHHVIMHILSPGDKMDLLSKKIIK